MTRQEQMERRARVALSFLNIAVTTTKPGSESEAMLIRRAAVILRNPDRARETGRTIW